MADFANVNQQSFNENYNYTYPNGISFNPNGELHRKTVARIMQLAAMSRTTASQRYSSWRETDNKLNAFIDLTEDEKILKQNNPNKPVSIVFPYSYAIMETVVSYMCSAFFPDPIFRYEGVGPEDTVGATLLERLISLQVAKTKVALSLHTMFRDATAYGMAFVGPQWQREVKSEKEFTDRYDFTPSGQAFNTGDRQVKEVERLQFEGNSLINIDPYRALPDPNVAIHEIQKGQFFGWFDHDNYYNLLDMEGPVADRGYFNVKYLKNVSSGRSALYDRGRENDRRQDFSVFGEFQDRDVDLIHMYVKIIPKEWELGDGEYPEKWLFTIAADSLIIRANPIGFEHNKFPIAVCAPEFDGYSPIAYSRLDIVNGMQTVIDWLFNSHIANVRKTLNNIMIVDPYMVNVKELMNAGSGGIVRLNRSAFGKDFSKAVQQLEMSDITGQNIQDVAVIIQFMQQISGTDNPVLGNLRQGGPERLTASEFDSTYQGAVTRLERMALVMGLQAMQDIGFFFASHVQQLMQQSTYVRVTGEWPSTITSILNREGKIDQDRVLVSPQELSINYDVVVRDGSIPGNNFSDAWVQIFQIALQDPQLRGQVDILRIFRHIATNLGAKNIDDFIVKTAPDDQVAAGVQAGNVVPVDQVTA